MSDQPEDPANEPEDATPAPADPPPASDDSPPATEESPREPGDDPADKAKEMASQAVDTFKGFDIESKIYVIGLGVALLCSLFFSLVTTSFGGFSGGSGSMVNAGFWGGLSVLAAAGGVGVFLWATLSNKKDSWIPLAVAGAAGLCALCFLIVRFSVGEIPGGMGVSISWGLLGWYLPFAGAVAATVVSVRKIMNASKA